MSANTGNEKPDFENPSLLFKLEDILKNLIGRPLSYAPFYKMFKLKGSERVLDFGCGGGAGSVYLARHLRSGGYLASVDSSKYWIKKAKERLSGYPNAECFHGDIRRMNIDDYSFDVVSVIHVIHDIHNEERESIVKTLSKKLKTGSLLYIKEPVKRSHGIPAEELRKLLSNAGLREINGKETKSEYTGKYQKIV
mgnify:CR=1 FL=1